MHPTKFLLVVGALLLRAYPKSWQRKSWGSWSQYKLFRSQTRVVSVLARTSVYTSLPITPFWGDRPRGTIGIGRDIVWLFYHIRRRMGTPICKFAMVPVMSWGGAGIDQTGKVGQAGSTLERRPCCRGRARQEKTKRTIRSALLTLLPTTGAGTLQSGSRLHAVQRLFWIPALKACPGKLISLKSPRMKTHRESSAQEADAHEDRCFGLSDAGDVQSRRTTER